jgi:xanthosine utilization system XapX-like protein
VFNILLADTPTPPEWVFFGRVGIVVGILAGIMGIIAGVVTVVWFFRTVLPDLLKPLKVEFRSLTFPSTRVLEDAFE